MDAVSVYVNLVSVITIDYGVFMLVVVGVNRLNFPFVNSDIPYRVTSDLPGLPNIRELITISIIVHRSPVKPDLPRWPFEYVPIRRRLSGVARF